MAGPADDGARPAAATPFAGQAASPVPAADPQPAPGSSRDQPLELHGLAAVERLDDLGTTAEVAANASLSEVELVEELSDDPLMFVTGEGMVGYTEPATAPDAAGDNAEAMAASEAMVAPQAIGTDVFDLSSRPSSTRVVYLDFTGHRTVGDYWNSNYRIAEIVSAPYSVDSNPAFSDAERQRIADIWKMVADDYAPFDVNVTTRDPDTAGLRKTSSADGAYGQRVVITSSDWYYQVRRNAIGGIALVDVFSSSFDHSAFVFAGNLGDGAVKTVGEAASHEAGHTLGLLHDGAERDGYYGGHGDWAPVMGVGYYKPITQWSKGEYAGASNIEDDLALIQEHTPIAADDHGDTAGAATSIPSSSATTGQIAVADVDVFTVTVGPGALSATLTPTGANLHATVTIRDSLGQLVASGSPQQAVGWVSAAAAPVPAGTYTITVAPSGWLTASTGFTSYASLGGYALSVAAAASGTTVSAQPPDTGSTLVAMTPARLADTRTGLGGTTRLAAGAQMSVQVTGLNGVPTSATSAVVNLTAVDPGAAGYLSVFPCASGTSSTSAVNYTPGRAIANTTIATLDPDGRICVWTLEDTDVLVDITGWLAPDAGARLQPIVPTRVADTRVGLGGSSRLAAGSTLELDLTPWTGASASAVALNVTAVGATGSGFLTAYPCGTAVPTTSTVNHAAGETRPNNTIVGLGNGRVCIYTLAEADVLVDLVGAFGATGLAYVPVAPTRLVDTRELAGPLSPASVIEYGLGELAGQTPQAAFVNVTAVGHAADGFTSTFACDDLPATSTLNQLVGEVAANGAIVPASASGTSCAWMLNGGDLAVDLSGWWVS